MLIQCHGCFDLLHIGHIRYLEYAKSLGTRLIVTITADQYVNKGPGRPLFNEADRLAMIKALKCVDHAEINHHPTALEAIFIHRPDIYCKGIDYQQSTPELELERQAVESYGGKLLIATTPKWSSTEIMRKLPISMDSLNQRRPNIS